MQGIYKLIINDVVYEQRNIITKAGKSRILDAVAGKSAGFANSIVAGIGATTATENDTELEYAVGGNDINAVIVDPLNKKIYFKATLPVNDSYQIYELGCFGINYTGAQNNFGAGNINLVTFGGSATWLDVDGVSTLATTNNRIGNNSVQYSAFSTAKGYMDFVFDFSLLTNAATFDLAYYTEDISSMILRFKVDADNYFEVDSWPVTDGYHIYKMSMADFVATGTPNWAGIQQLEIEAAGSAATLSLDSLRYSIPTVSEAIESSLFSRVVLDTPQQKLAGVSMDIEYVLELDI